MLELGILLIASALLSIYAARAVFLRPSPPRWTTWDTPGNLIVVVITALAGFGLAATGMGIAGIVSGTESPLHAVIGALLLAALVAAPFLYRRYRHRPTPLAG